MISVIPLSFVDGALLIKSFMPLGVILDGSIWVYKLPIIGFCTSNLEISLNTISNGLEYFKNFL